MAKTKTQKTNNFNPKPKKQLKRHTKSPNKHISKKKNVGQGRN